MKRHLPAYVYPRGKRGYLYFIRQGVCIRIHDEPGSPEFALTYARLLRGNVGVESSRTIKKLVKLYMRSDRWSSLAFNTRRGYERHLRYFVDVMPNLDPATLRRVHVIRMRDDLADKPTDASRKVQTLSTLLEYAIDIGWLDRNPAKGVSLLRGNRPPRQPWPADMVDAFRSHAEGRPLLIFELLIGTGQRISDVLRMQWGHIKDDGIHVRQGKTGTSLWIPFTDLLRDILAKTPRNGLFIVSQADGRPVSYPLAWKEVMKVREAIGAQAHDIHALRHSAASELANLGLDDAHIMAITGHRSSAMVRLYAGAAAQKARAKEAQKRREKKPRTKPEF